MSNLHLHNRYVMYEAELSNCLDNLGSGVLQFAPDMAHLVCAGAEPAEVIRKYADRVNFSHFKDIPAGGVSSRGFADFGVELFDFVELGTGCVNFREVFDILKEAGYDGPLCAELDKAPISNAIFAEKNYNFILENY